MDTPDREIRSPFKFLDPYARKDGEIFFGRDEEVETLYQFVNKNRLVLVYGQSGTGKTSLVQCGLANRFEVTDWVPFFIRRGKNINASLYQAVSKSKALGGIEVKEDNLLTALDRISTRYIRSVYLIFDQFEELLILGEKKEIDQFLGTIKKILESPETQSVILLFVLREEYFAWLDDFERVIPHFSSRRLRVEPMRPNRLEEVVLESCASFKIKLEKGRENARQIIENLRSKGGIPLPYLQVYLDMLWREDYARTYPDGRRGRDHVPLVFTTKEIEDFGAIKDVLDRFLLERSEAIQLELETGFPNLEEDTVSRVLDAFATEEGTKRPVNYYQEEELLHMTGNVPPFLKQLPALLLTACLRKLEQNRILRADDDSFELAHDTLAALIDQKRTDEQRRLNRLRRLVKSNYEVDQALTVGHLAEIGENLDKLALEPEKRQFVEESRNQRRKEQQAALHEEGRRRRIAYLIAGVCMALAAFAGWQYLRADAQTQEARRLADIASNKTVEAEDANKALVIQKNTALAAQQYAEQQRGISDSLAEVATLNLLKLQKSSDRVAGQLLEEAVQLIYQIKYAEALEKLQAALPLKKRLPEMTEKLMELAFFYNESGRADQALGITRTLLQIKGSDREQILSNQAERTRNPRSIINQTLKDLDAKWYEDLERRYYPEMVDVKGGFFCLGVLVTPEFCDTSDQALVEIDDFRIARTETTVWQYALFAAATDREMVMPSWGWAGDNPVVNVSWYDALAYANWLSRQINVDPVYQLENIPQNPNDLEEEAIDWSEIPNWNAGGFRLPTEEEWEYAARGGVQKDTFSFSGHYRLDSVGWYSGNSDVGYGVKRTHPVGLKLSNGLDLFDMSGNVWEWCWNRWDKNYPSGRFRNPRGPEKGSYRLLRGGAWSNTGEDSRVDHRDNFNPDYRYHSYGFRLVQ